MTNALKKIGRKDKLKKTKQVEKSLTSQLNMFDLLPERCDTCLKAFDKKSKEMAMEWTVVVRSKEKTVRLFCPECVSKAKEIIEKHD